MKCDELKVENACVYGPNTKVYIADQVDEAFAELKARIAELKQKLNDAEMRADLAEAACTEYRMDYKKLEETQRWRKVSEELPEEQEIVWVYHEIYKETIKAIHYGRGKFVYALYHSLPCSASYWMPMTIPKAPEVADK